MAPEKSTFLLRKTEKKAIKRPWEGEITGGGGEEGGGEGEIPKHRNELNAPLHY